jgi:hypothetical protein
VVFRFIFVCFKTLLFVFLGFWGFGGLWVAFFVPPLADFLCLGGSGRAVRLVLRCRLLKAVFAALRHFSPLSLPPCGIKVRFGGGGGLFFWVVVVDFV